MAGIPHELKNPETLKKEAAERAARETARSSEQAAAASAADAAKMVTINGGDGMSALDKAQLESEKAKVKLLESQVNSNNQQAANERYTGMSAPIFKGLESLSNLIPQAKK